MTDIEPSFTSAQFKSVEQRCGLTLHYADPRHSTSNGQVERALSTLKKLDRCLKEEFNLTDYSLIVIRPAQNIIRVFNPQRNKTHLTLFII